MRECPSCPISQIMPDHNSKVNDTTTHRSLKDAPVQRACLEHRRRASMVVVVVRLIRLTGPSRQPPPARAVVRDKREWLGAGERDVAHLGGLG